MPAPYNTFTPEQVREQLDADLQADAADLVQRWAPAPDPLPDPDTYSPKAARAERRLYRYMKEVGNLTSKNVGGVITKGYKDMSEARRIVREVMGEHYTGGARSLPIV